MYAHSHTFTTHTHTHTQTHHGEHDSECRVILVLQAEDGGIGAVKVAGGHFKVKVVLTPKVRIFPAHLLHIRSPGAQNKEVASHVKCTQLKTHENNDVNAFNLHVTET